MYIIMIKHINDDLNDFLRLLYTNLLKIKRKPFAKQWIPRNMLEISPCTHLSGDTNPKLCINDIDNTPSLSCTLTVACRIMPKLTLNRTLSGKASNGKKNDQNNEFWSSISSPNHWHPQLKERKCQILLQILSPIWPMESVIQWWYHQFFLTGHIKYCSTSHSSHSQCHHWTDTTMQFTSQEYLKIKRELIAEPLVTVSCN